MLRLLVALTGCFGPRRRLSSRALIFRTGPVTERLRVREIDDDEGQRLMRSRLLRG